MEKLKGFFNPQYSRSSSPNPPPVSFFPGVEVLYDCSEATIDICFVHGLTGNRDSTWTAHGQSIPWPKTLLPPKLRKARILTYGYDAYIVRKSVASSNRLIDHATNLLNDLTTDRAWCKASTRPLFSSLTASGALSARKPFYSGERTPKLIFGAYSIAPKASYSWALLTREPGSLNGPTYWLRSFVS